MCNSAGLIVNINPILLGSPPTIPPYSTKAWRQQSGFPVVWPTSVTPTQQHQLLQPRERGSHRDRPEQVMPRGKQLLSCS